MKLEFTVLSVGLLIFFMIAVGPVAADPLVPAVNETMGIQAGTSINVDGLMSETNEMIWEITNGALDNTLNVPGPLIGEFDGTYWIVYGNPVLDIFPGKSAGEVQYTTAYTESTMADVGTVDYTKQLAVDTANAAPGQPNIDATRIIEFTSGEIGTLTSSEKLTLDGAGQFDFTADKFICPFASESSDFIPAFCNIVETGSDLQITSGSLATNANERFVSATSDYPLSLDYSIKLTGVDGPAIGSVSAYLTAHTQEGAVNVLAKVPYPEGMGTTYFVTSNKVSDLQYDEHTTASGQIDLFNKIMHYESGVSR
jgi:hypothetical protein